MSRPRGWRTLTILFSLAVVSSIAHYTDNTINFDEYPHPEPGSIVPDPPDWLVGSSWFAFTAVGVLGVWWYAQNRILPAAVAIAVYSVSGTISIGHYLAPGATGMAPLRQVSIGIDIVLGVLLLGLALWAALKVRPSPASRGTAR